MLGHVLAAISAVVQHLGTFCLSEGLHLQARLRGVGAADVEELHPELLVKPVVRETLVHHGGGELLHGRQDPVVEDEPHDEPVGRENICLQAATKGIQQGGQEGHQPGSRPAFKQQGIVPGCHQAQKSTNAGHRMPALGFGFFLQHHLAEWLQEHAGQLNRKSKRCTGPKSEKERATVPHTTHTHTHTHTHTQHTHTYTQAWAGVRRRA